MYANGRETFVNMFVDMVFKFQWHIEKHIFNALGLGWTSTNLYVTNENNNL